MKYSSKQSEGVLYHQKYSFLGDKVSHRKRHLSPDGSPHWSLFFQHLEMLTELQQQREHTAAAETKLQEATTHHDQVIKDKDLQHGMALEKEQLRKGSLENQALQAKIKKDDDNDRVGASSAKKKNSSKKKKTGGADASQTWPRATEATEAGAAAAGEGVEAKSWPSTPAGRCRASHF